MCGASTCARSPARSRQSETTAGFSRSRRSSSARSRPAIDRLPRARVEEVEAGRVDDELERLALPRAARAAEAADERARAPRRLALGRLLRRQRLLDLAPAHRAHAEPEVDVDL